MIPDEVIFDRAPVLVHTLRHLPSDSLRALVVGLESNLDRLTPGRLFESRTGGGCAVGVMLRELEPSRFGRGRLRYWWRLRHLQTVGDDRSLSHAMPRLRHVELVFDTTVEQTIEARPDLSEREASRAVGTWFSVEAQSELARRRRVLSPPTASPRERATRS